MSIRIADLKDLDLIKRYDKHVAEPEYTDVLASGRVIVAEENGDFIGWLRYNYFWDSIPFLNMLYVLDGHRGKGYGKKLMDHWEKDMKRLGFHTVLTSTQANEYSQHFYDKLGYKTVGGFLLGNEPYEIIMSKEI